MACFPRIDQPCPMGVDAQKRIAGYCGLCRKTVHALDGLDGAARSALFANASGPICVSYRVPARIGAALMLSMAGAVFASEIVDKTASPASIAGESHAPAAITTIDAPPTDLAEEPEIMMLGGVSDPQSVEWVDAADAHPLPELPVIDE